MADFHFIRPEWLFAIPLIFIIVYLLKRLQISNSGWQQVIPPHLAQKLIDGDNQSKQGFSLVIPALLTLLAIIALAGPAWQKLPQPVYNVQKGAVIIMDMSNSMYATDLSPNRLTRARYKAIDLLEKLNEGDIGLIAYAGDSFIISPLTEDINNIKLLLPALSPQLMPVQGSNPLLALTMANDMLINAGHINGDIYWLTDDVDQYDVKEVTNFASSINHSINILGIGSKTGAPIKMPDGQLLKDNSGAIVLPHLTESALAAIAQRGRGAYQTIRNNSDDINALVSNAQTQAELKDEESQFSEGDQFKEAGPYLLLIMLPLMLGYFRRGNLLAILPCLLFFTNMPDSYAQQAISPKTTTEAPSNSFWQDLWQTQDQQAQEKYQQEQYDAAAKQFTEPMWQGSAHYKNGDFEQALKAFQQSDSADALYNQGNSLAKLQKLDEAIKAYEQALAKNPDFEAAKANKALIEQLKEQQDQQQQNQDKNSDNADENQQDQQNNQDQKQEQEQEQQSNDQQAQNQQQQNDSQSSEQQNQQEQPSEQEQQDQQQASEEQAEQEPEQTSEQESPAEQSEGENGEEQEAQSAQLTEAEQAAKEEEQKHQQLLKKVTDDPYLLLRNKMQLEYQKRRNQTSGVNKKW